MSAPTAPNSTAAPTTAITTPKKANLVKRPNTKPSAIILAQRRANSPSRTSREDETASAAPAAADALPAAATITPKAKRVRDPTANSPQRPRPSGVPTPLPGPLGRTRRHQLLLPLQLLILLQLHGLLRKRLYERFKKSTWWQIPHTVPLDKRCSALIKIESHDCVQPSLVLDCSISPAIYRSALNRKPHLRQTASAGNIGGILSHPSMDRPLAKPPDFVTVATRPCPTPRSAVFSTSIYSSERGRTQQSRWPPASTHRAPPCPASASCGIVPAQLQGRPPQPPPPPPPLPLPLPLPLTLPMPLLMRLLLRSQN